MAWKVKRMVQDDVVSTSCDRTVGTLSVDWAASNDQPVTTTKPAIADHSPLTINPVNMERPL
jgi:hypothetical protein